AGRQVISGMQSVMAGHPRGDFGMAALAFQLRLTAELVTRRTLSGTFKRLMRARQRPGRDLRPGGGQHQYAGAEAQKSERHGEAHCNSASGGFRPRHVKLEFTKTAVAYAD